MDRPRILGQVNPSATTKTILYALPVDNTGRAQSSVLHTVISSISVCNFDSTSATISIWIMNNVDTASTANKELLAGGMTVAGNSVSIINAGISLQGEPEIQSGGSGTSAGIVVEASTVNVAFQAFGVEVLR